jgi:hypothetical protein
MASHHSASRRDREKCHTVCSITIGTRFAEGDEASLDQSDIGVCSDRTVGERRRVGLAVRVVARANLSIVEAISREKDGSKRGDPV